MAQLLWQMYKQKENGTHGRKWYTDQKDNIAFSFLLEVNCKISQLEGITIEIAQTMVEVLKKLYDISLTIKFPNDLVYKGKKLGGILTETKLKGEYVKYVVIGIGMNTNQEKFSPEISKIASSIKKEFQITVDAKKVIAEFCNGWEAKIQARLVNQ